MNWKKALLVAGLCTVCTVGISQADNRLADVKPSDWAYQALMTLEKHGALTDTKGLNLGTQVYTRYELTPLVADIVERRETMNDTDKNIAIRLYSEFREDLMQYNRDQEIREGKRGEDAISQGQQPALTREEIAEKMKHFEVDSSKVQTGGDVRLRFDNRGRSDARARVGVVISSSGVAAPDALYDKVGKQAIAQADEEAAKSREKFQENRARIEAEEKAEQAKADKAAAKAQAKADKEAAKAQAKADKAAAKAQAKADKEAAKEQGKSGNKESGVQAQSGPVVQEVQEAAQADAANNGGANADAKPVNPNSAAESASAAQ